MTSHSSHDHCSVVCQLYTEEPIDINAPHAVGLHSVDLDVCIT